MLKGEEGKIFPIAAAERGAEAEGGRGGEGVQSRARQDPGAEIRSLGEDALGWARQKPSPAPSIDDGGLASGPTTREFAVHRRANASDARPRRSRRGCRQSRRAQSPAVARKP